MGNFFKKRWVTIFFICFMMFGFAAAVNAQVRCYLCNDNPDPLLYPKEYWMTNPASCPGGQSSSGAYYDTRAGYSCNDPCGNDQSTCDYADKKVCYSNSSTDPDLNFYNICSHIIDYKCLWTRNASTATAVPTTWEKCSVTGNPYCESINWYNNAGTWQSWTNSGDAECGTTTPYTK
ncbi:MAG: hypothetical protein GY795_33200 [Desulfobacterales bacterium]|nr:hypothetical protein [Desulfobacterales bacterium]